MSLKFLSKSYSISAIALLYLVGLFNLVVFNFPVLAYIVNQSSDFWPVGFKLLLLISALLFSLTFILFALLAIIHRMILKISIILIFIANSIALYFMSTYQVILDKSMMGNIINTRMSEAGELFTVSLLFYVIVLGVLPALILLKLRINKCSFLGYVKHSLMHLIVTAIVAYLFSSTWLWIDEHAKKLGGKILPWSYIANTARFIKEQNKKNIEYKELPPIEVISEAKQFVVLVIGETARSHNFSLYGYQRNTNPRLSMLPIIPLDNATSCSTYTTASLECILAHEEETSIWGEQFEPLPTYLSRQGVNVTWITNNWGEPKITVNSYIEAQELRDGCTHNECEYDGVLLDGIKTSMAEMVNDKVFVVLHQKGSHGPLYSQRYPQKFTNFQPECNSVDLTACSDEELVNSYDNSILYTDHFLAELINILENIKDYESTLIYISDHGESLGEGGVYLHGTPKSMAPEYQYQIPFLVWSSTKKTLNSTIKNYTQANVFHTVLGALGLSSEVYKDQMDVYQNVKKSID
ncbi:MAG: phosphoethanolamine--lipid A transferase EptA [Marinicella sp.]|nr:phosphoethanolamine--lipid A transferase EptA [Xanthomonadales bacterium]